jgi:hypothetical protein
MRCVLRVLGLVSWIGALAFVLTVGKQMIRGGLRVLGRRRDGVFRVRGWE